MHKQPQTQLDTRSRSANFSELIFFLVKRPTWDAPAPVVSFAFTALSYNRA